MLNRRYDIRLELEEVLYAYTTKRHSSSKCYFVANANPLQLVVNLPDASKNKLQGYVLLFDIWGCARDLRLRGVWAKIRPRVRSGVGLLLR